MVSTDDKLNDSFFCSTKACHQGHVGIVEDGAPSDLFSRLGHLPVDKGPILVLGQDFLSLALLDFSIFDVF